MTPHEPDPRPIVHRPRAQAPRPSPVREVSIFIVGFAVGLAGLLVAQRFAPQRQDPDIEHYLEVRRFVVENFVDDVDPDQLVRDALEGMIAGLDGYSTYYSTQADYARVDRETSGSFTGIGVVLQRPLDEGRVLFPVPTGPAMEAGLRVGDRILSIDGTPLTDMGPGEIGDHLGGEAGSLVELVVVGRDEEQRTLEVQRRSVIEPTVRHARVLDEERGIGYLAITGFSHMTRQEFDRAVQWLLDNGAQGLVIDLRNNPGGVLGAAIDIARRFIPSGSIVSTRGRAENVRIDADPAHAIWSDLPLVVLVDEHSASASEVLAGALQDHRAAVIVGQPTHGKGMVQTLSRYPERSAIAKVTTSHYYTPAERNLERDPEAGRDFGIVPDLEVSIDGQEQREVIMALGRFKAPFEFLDELRAWEQEEGLTLIDPPLLDTQLRAALDLLRGHRPAVAAAPK